MPVRIEIGDTSDDPRVIDLQEYADGRANFTLHYYYTPAEAPFYGQVIDAPWNDLQNAVDTYRTQTDATPDEVAMRFVHCFTPGMESMLFLRLQICKMVPSDEPPPPGVSTVYDLDTNGALWYEINNGNFTPTADETLFGAEYLDNFYYKSEPQSAVMEPLSSGPALYVKNLVLPWGDEILTMYRNNGSPDDAGIHFAACSYIATPEHANVEWPHGMVIYLSSSDDTPMLDNNNYIHIFHNKGADFATLCPPTCNQYLAPSV